VESQRALLRAVIDAMPGGVALKTLDGTLLLINAYTAGRFGRTPAELEGRSEHNVGRGDYTQRMHELDATKETVVFCRTGGRSARAVEFLQSSGFGKVWNLKGGIHAWSNEIDPTVVKY